MKKLLKKLLGRFLEGLVGIGKVSKSVGLQ